MSKQLIQEERRAPVKVLESDGTGVFRFSAVVSEADLLNRNRRVYPQDVLFPAFEAYNTALMHGEGAPGLVDHPEYQASMSDIGILWESFAFEGKLVVGNGRIVSTQRGKDLQAAMEAGIAVGFSTRGYGELEEFVAADGKPANRMMTYDLETVDAVVSPSVKHARVRNFTKEETEQMEEELRAAKEALAAALARIAELEGAAATEAGEHAAVVADRDGLRATLEAAQAQVTELEAAAAELTTLRAAAEALRVENELTAKLNALTEGHRFAATIVTEARELGVNAENVEKVVTRLRALVEAAGAAANEQVAARGDVSTDEDAVVEKTVTVKYTAEQLDDLRQSNLMSENEYRELLAQLS